MSDRQHILVVDDDPVIRDLLEEYLRANDYRVTVASHGAALFAQLEAGAVDLIVLDVMLPGESGFDLCRSVREKREIPIIMLTARNQSEDRVRGLELGADDYLAKPFEPRELVARIRGVLRRTGAAVRATGTDEPPKALSFSGWTLDLRRRQLISPKQVLVPLAASEFQLLEIFLGHPHTVLTRDQLMDLCHGREAGPFDRSIDVRVSQLRHRLCDSGREPQLIKTVRGAGYLFAADVARIHR